MQETRPGRRLEIVHWNLLCPPQQPPRLLGRQQWLSHRDGNLKIERRGLNLSLKKGYTFKKKNMGGPQQSLSRYGTRPNKPVPHLKLSTALLWPHMSRSTEAFPYCNTWKSQGTSFTLPYLCLALAVVLKLSLLTEPVMGWGSHVSATWCASRFGMWLQPSQKLSASGQYHDPAFHFCQTATWTPQPMTTQRDESMGWLKTMASTSWPSMPGHHIIWQPDCSNQSGLCLSKQAHHFCSPQPAT